MSLTINFDAIKDGQLTTYTEFGFTVVSLSNNWFAVTSFGNPAPFIDFTNSAIPVGTTIPTATISVSDSGVPFSFNSVDLYSSVTPIPYKFTGLFGGKTVFQVSDTVPNTFGTFATVANPNATALIDTLQITLSDPAAGVSNPVGLDNLVVTGAPPLTLQYVAPGDFTGSAADLVFANAGNAVIWTQGSNGSFGQVNVANAHMGTEWSAFDTGAFTGAGKTGLLWSNGSGGQVALWQLNGGQLTAFSLPQGRMGSEWHVASLGDFNGDHTTDVLWENAQGQLNVWSLKDLTLQSAAPSNGQIGAEWHIITHGDLFGSGKDGLLWEDTLGDLQSWALNGAEVTKIVDTVGRMGSEWRCAGVGSFQNDGPTDVVWVNGNNDLQIWQMDNGAISRIITPQGRDGMEWHLTAVASFDGGGNSNLLWLNSNGSADIWQINGSQVSSHLVATPVGEPLVF